jgi:hypothetical protein
MAEATQATSWVGVLVMLDGAGRLLPTESLWRVAEAVRVAAAAVVRRVAERRVAGMVYPLGVEAPNQRVVVPRVMEVLGH